MKKRLMIAAIFTMLLSITAIHANSNSITDDKTLRFTGGFNSTNPCNGEFIQGPIEINIVVSTNQAPDGRLLVNVHHTSHGVLANAATGNEYQISRVGKGQFGTVANQYVIPWRGEFIGKGMAPNFTVIGEVRVFVNTQNEPTGSQLVFQQGTCSQ
jgi:hypothetical protein